MISDGLRLRVRDLAKCYRLYDHPVDRIKELVLGRPRHQELWVLQGISFTLSTNSSVGIIGENGAGKSTLLKLVAGVLTSSAGSVELSGRAASIIELGTGFHPELSGRENLFVGGTVLGLSRRQIEAKIPEIEEFSELGAFLDRPLKSYSTGMAMRLAFSLAISVEPSLLIVDEALSVGDGYFQKKCVDRIHGFQQQGGSLLLCSHSLYTVNRLCRDALWLKQGRMEAYGPTAQVTAAYESYLMAKNQKEPDWTHGELQQGGRLTSLVLSGDGEAGSGPTLTQGTELQIHIGWESDSPERAFHLGVTIDRSDNLTCFGTTTLKHRLPTYCGQTSYAAVLRFPALQLTNGSFRVHVFLFDQHGVHVYDEKYSDRNFTVVSDEKEIGVCWLDHSWETVPAPAQPERPIVRRADDGAIGSP